MGGYIPNTDRDRQLMCESIGISSVEDLFSDIPENVRFRGRLNIPEGLSELEVADLMARLSSKNTDTSKLVCFAGAGAYDHFIPSVVGHVLARSEFYTAYTPYQAEVSQAVLQSIFEFQTLISQLTGMDVSNASMYDGATALAEAALMSVATTRRKKVLMSSAIHPEYREVVKTYAHVVDLDVVEIGYKDGLTDMEALESAVSKDVAAVMLQQPNFFGCIEDMEGASKVAHASGALFTACVDPISLGIMKPPGEYDADIAVGEGQGLGNPMSFGGPFLGFFATKEKLVRRMPGRLVGQTVDARGKRGFVLTLQTREQHIRRERATSNICSNEALNALAATVYLSTMGKQGIREVAGLSLKKAHYAEKAISSVPGFEAVWKAPFFKEFAVKCKAKKPSEIISELSKKGILPGVDLGRFYPELEGNLLIAVTEKRTKEQIDNLVRELGGIA